MQVFHKLDDLPADFGPTLISVGNFDGVHRAHTHVLRQVVGGAREQKLKAMAVAFDPHPVRILRPDVGLKLLTPTPEKLRLLELSRLDAVLLLPFTRDLSLLTPYGNPVLDVIITVGDGAAHQFERSALETTATIRRNGNLEFKPDSYIAFHLLGEPLVWGHLNPRSQDPVYTVGGKYRVPTVVGEAASQILNGDALVAALAGPHLQLGGGGANVLYGFYDVFAQIKVELIATVERHPPGERGRLDRFVDRKSTRLNSS